MRCLVALATLLAVAGCQTAPATCPAVPPLPTEVMPKAPISEPAPTWQPGYVDWDGRRYSFVAGRWIVRSGPDTAWMPGYWSRAADSGACLWVPAHWL